MNLITFQAVTSELTRLAVVKPAVEVAGESSKCKNDENDPEMLASKVRRQIFSMCLFILSILHF